MLDVVLFGALVVASNPAWTGLGIHEWLAGVILLPVLYHVAINWDSVRRVAMTFLRRLLDVSRLNLAVDIVLFVATIAVMVTGLMVIPGVIPTIDDTTVFEVWRDAHRVSSDIVIAAMIVHLLLHARWMLEAAVTNLLPQPGRHSSSRRRRLSGRRRAA